MGEVQFDAVKKTARRAYRGGEITTLMDGSTDGWIIREVRVQYLGFHAIETQGGLGSDEPYFVVSVDTKAGDPTTRTFKYQEIEEGDDVGDSSTVIDQATPDPLVITVVGFENDMGDPDETAKEVQAQMVKLSKEAAAVAGAMEGAADGPAAGAIGTAGGALGGAWGAVLALLVVEIFGMGDDYIAQNATTLFVDGGIPTTPPDLGTFNGSAYNAKVRVANNDGERKYELYFHVLVRDNPMPVPVPKPAPM